MDRPVVPTVGVGDEEVAAMIRADRIDVLFCMAGHTAGNRLLVCARKPAPVCKPEMPPGCRAAWWAPTPTSART